MAALIPRASLSVIDSPHGHDAFLIEIEELNKRVAAWMQGDGGALPPPAAAAATAPRL